MKCWLDVVRMICMCVFQVVPMKFVEDLNTMMALLQFFCNGRVSLS